MVVPIDRLKDSTLIKLKDLVLLLLALGSFFSIIVKVYSKPEQLEGRLTNLEMQVEERAKKYLPMVDSHTVQIAIINTQYENILRELGDIKRRMK